MEWSWPWAALLLLGAIHGINPGMGWLFAVALGLQEDRAAAVWKALPPLAIGHAVAVGSFVALASAMGAVVPFSIVKVAAAAALFGFGLFKLRYQRHPRYGGMRVGQLQLAIWSFLMASAHGAGLMAVPFVLRAAPIANAHHVRALNAGMSSPQAAAWTATLLHSASYLLFTAGIALVVYKKTGLRLLRTAWINVDVIWALALMATAVLTLVW